MLSFASSLGSDSEAFAIFVNDKFDFKDRKNLLSKETNKKINSYLSALKYKKSEEEIISLDISAKQKCFIIKVKKKYETYYPEERGGVFYSYLKNFKNIKKIDIYTDSLDFEKEEIANFSSEFIFGYNLKSYTFDIYKTLDKKNSQKNIICKIITSHKEKIEKKYKHNDAIKSGVFLTRDLVSEPGNILHPDEYAKRLVKLKKFGLKVTVYDEEKLKKLGCNALVGVGQGSIRGSYLVTIEWNGKKSKSQPLAFVGKGVCFDTGGISLKPARFMEDMTYDMAGSAVVVGL